MPVKRAIPPNNGMFFIIFIGYQWLSLMDTINEYDIIYKWFDHLKSNHHLPRGRCPHRTRHYEPATNKKYSFAATSPTKPCVAPVVGVLTEYDIMNQ